MGDVTFPYVRTFVQAKMYKQDSDGNWNLYRTLQDKHHVNPDTWEPYIESAEYQVNWWLNYIKVLNKTPVKMKIVYATIEDTTTRKILNCRSYTTDDS